MTRYVFLPLLLALYLLVMIPFTSYMRHKPFVEKLGYLPPTEVVSLASGDQKLSVAAGLISKVLMYFGSLVEKSQQKVAIPPDYYGMFKHIETAVQLDPYNMDGYYFGQAILVWDVGRIREANSLLTHGMKYRTWDASLPFYVGFNYAYFLKDYPDAAKYYQKAAEISGNEMYVTLAGRYLYEGGQTDLAVAYLTAMTKSARNPAIRKTFETRLSALKEVQRIERARDRFRQEKGRLPSSVSELEQSHLLSPPPVDPYGGTFYLEPDGKVRTTSKLALPPKKEKREQ